MTAPVALARSTPTGIKMDDGHSTKVTIKADPDISFWEKIVQPPGLDGGDATPTTTMFNTTWRTFSPKKLITMTECNFRAAYDPVAYNQIVAAINDETTISVTFPDGSTLAFYGYLRSFTPQELVEGAQPEAQVVIQPTNQDASGNEEGPVMVEVAGT